MLCTATQVRADERSEEGVTSSVSGKTTAGAAISETVYDRIASQAKGQVQKKQIDSQGSTIIVDNTNGLATAFTVPHSEADKAKGKKNRVEDKKKNEEKYKKESEEEKKRDQQAEQAKKEKKEDLRKRSAQNHADEVVMEAKDREKRIAQKMKEKKSKEHTRKHFVDFTGTCTVASSCPPGWDNKGLAGMIVHSRHKMQNNFRKGEKFNASWRWMHPYVCCATSKFSKVNDLFVFNRHCPKGSKNQGMAGIIMVKKHYDKNPFHNGADYNDYWRWSHPYACQVRNSKIAKSAKSCLFAVTCPAGWTDNGFGGILIHNNYYEKQPFHKGGKYNDSWTWAHPRVCCL